MCCSRGRVCKGRRTKGQRLGAGTARKPGHTGRTRQGRGIGRRLTPSLPGSNPEKTGICRVPVQEFRAWTRQWHVPAPRLTKIQTTPREIRMHQLLKFDKMVTPSIIQVIYFMGLIIFAVTGTWKNVDVLFVLGIIIFFVVD